MMADLSRLSPGHLAMLRDQSGLSERIIIERGYFTANTLAEIKRLGFSDAQCLAPALVIPLFDAEGSQAGYQLRPDQPRVGADGKVIKYETPKGSRVMLDVPPRCRSGLGDPSQTLYVTEGTKKGDALAEKGLIVVAVSGVWNWRGSNDLGGKTALADWDLIAVNERLVRIVFDSDSARKAAVAQAMVRLKAFLELRHAIVEVIYLPDGEDGSKQGIDDFFAAGGTLEALDVLVSSTVMLPREDADGLPEIVVNGRHLPAISEDCWRVLHERNEPKPFLFTRDGGLVRVMTGVRSRIIEVEPQGLPFLLERFARFVKVGPPDSGYTRTPARMPGDVIEDMMEAWQKPLPPLSRIVRCPVATRTGAIAASAGYDRPSETFIDLGGRSIEAVPESPSAEDVRAAVEVLKEWLWDFPFADEGSLANTLAIPLTYILRDLIQGCTPLFAIDAPASGTGKGFLAQSTGEIVLGAAPAVLTEASDEDEWRKRITALLVEGAGFILIDNVKRRLASAAIQGALTAPRWTDRLLGATRIVDVPNLAVWMVTGNNLQFDVETGRRVVSIRLDAKSDRPWEDRDFRHPNFLEWVSENRLTLVRAFLVLTQHWFALGRPAWTGRPLATFESWSRIVGGVLEAAGVDGLLANREQLYADADRESQEWRDFVAEWWVHFKSAPMKAGDLAVLVRDDELLPGLVATVKGELTDKALSVRLGRALGKRKNQRIGKYFLRSLGRDSHKKGEVYALEPAEDAFRSGEPSADLPHESELAPDSNAEGAETAEGVSDTHAGCEYGTDGGDALGDSVLREGRGHIPHLPHIPQSGSEGDELGAEGVAEGRSPLGNVPRCVGCGREMSVVAVGDRCGWCLKGSHP